MSIFFGLQDFISVENYLFLHYFAVIKLNHNLATWNSLVESKKLPHSVIFFESSQFLKTQLLYLSYSQQKVSKRVKHAHYIDRSRVSFFQQIFQTPKSIRAKFRIRVIEY